MAEKRRVESREGLGGIAQVSMEANLHTWASSLRAKGVWGSIRDALDRIIGSRPLPWFSQYESCFRDGPVLEIGGPSWVFSSKGFAPIYPLSGRLDSVNFSGSTIWHRPSVAFGRNYKLPVKPGGRYLAEATNLSMLAPGAYAAVLASHVLEHVADPISALLEWKRIVREGGIVLIVVPDKTATFDHRRPTTSVDHMISDHVNAVTEGDMTHLPEILALHDLLLDPVAGRRDEFVVRSKENLRYRGLHHHVFDVASLESLTHYAGFDVLEGCRMRAHIVVLLRRPVAS